MGNWSLKTIQSPLRAKSRDDFWLQGVYVFDPVDPVPTSRKHLKVAERKVGILVEGGEFQGLRAFYTAQRKVKSRPRRSHRRSKPGVVSTRVRKDVRKQHQDYLRRQIEGEQGVFRGAGAENPTSYLTTSINAAFQGATHCWKCGMEKKGKVPGQEWKKCRSKTCAAERKAVYDRIGADSQVPMEEMHPNFLGMMGIQPM